MENNEETANTKELLLSKIIESLDPECYDYNYDIQNNQSEEVQDKQDTKDKPYYQQEETKLDSNLRQC